MSTVKLHTFKIIWRTDAVYLEVHSRLRNSNFCFKWPVCSYCAPLSLGATNFENSHSPTKGLVGYASDEDGVTDSCVTCSLHTVLHGATEPCVYLRTVQHILAETLHFQIEESVRLVCLVHV